MATYAWKPGSRIPVDPDVAGRRLEALAASSPDGVVRPRDVVEAARPADAPLHPAFEWDDRVAAERWREEQARHIIRSLVVVHTSSSGQNVPIRAFVRVTSVSTSDAPSDREKNSGYAHVYRAMEHQEWRQQVLEEAKRELHAFVEKYRALSQVAAELARAVSLVQEAEAVIEGATEKDARQPV